MKKNFKYFAITWAVLFAMFNVVTFVVPNEIMGITRFDKAIFWIGYAFIFISLVAELVVFYMVCRSDDAKKSFLNLSYLSLSYGFVVASVFIGLAFMVVPVIPTWIGAIVCLLILGGQIISALKVHAAVENVTAVGNNVEVSTNSMRKMVADAEVIVKLANNNEIKNETKKVYDALRFSDYVSNFDLREIDEEISKSLKSLKELVENKKDDETKQCIDGTLKLIEERSVKCKKIK